MPRNFEAWLLAVDSSEELRGSRRRSVSEERGILQGVRENSKNLEHELGEVGDRLTRELGETFESTSYWYVTNIISCDNPETLRLLWERCCDIGNERYRGQFFSATFEEEENHIHLAHACAFSNRQCRCLWKEDPLIRRFIRQPRKQSRRLSSIGFDGWRNILIYFIYRKWNCETKIWINRAIQRLPSSGEIIRWRKMYEERTSKLLAEQQGTRDGHNIFGGEQSSEFMEQTDNSGNKRVAKKRSYYSRIKEDLEELLNTFIVYPIDNIRNYKDFYENDVFVDPKNVKIVNQVFENYKKEICFKSTKELEKYYYKDNLVLKFGCGFKEFDDFYLDLESSFNVVLNLLNFQFDNDEENIKIFLQTFINILDRKIPKLNTMCIVGPPQAGKNFFVDMILACYRNVGQIGSVINRNNRFAYANVRNRRVAYWNEPNYESCEIEQLKQVLGGDVYTVNVKCQEDSSVMGTPVIILTNTYLSLMAEPAFQKRLYKVNFRQAQFLKSVMKKPSPITWFKILKHYGINY